MFLALFALLASARAQTPIACCDDPQVQRAVEAVAEVAEAVARDSDGGARELAALQGLRTGDGMSAADRDAIAKIRRAAKAQGTYRDGASRALAYVTRYAVFLALRHEGGSLVVAEGWCEAEQKGWLQTDLKELNRPWKDCGSWR